MFSITIFLIFPAFVSAALQVDNEAACLKNHGRWLTIKMYDSGKNGWEGNALHMLDANLKEMYQWTFAVGKESTANLCLDYFGEDFSECYTLFMDAEGLHQEEVSWEFSVKTKKDKGIKEAKQEGGSPDEAKLMCGRRYKKLGKYSLRQIEKVGVDTLKTTRSQKARSKRALEKIESRAEKLNLILHETQPMDMNNEW